MLDHPEKGEEITTYIQTVQISADILGAQECDDPVLISKRTGYLKGSPFIDSQGFFVRQDVFLVEEHGFSDINTWGK